MVPVALPSCSAMADGVPPQQLIGLLAYPEVRASLGNLAKKSLEAYESGWKKAVELGIFNAWTAKMRDALGRLNGELYPPLKEIGLDIRASAPASFPPLLGGPHLGTPNRERPSSPRGQR